MEEFAPSPVIETLTIETLTLNYLNVLTRDQVIWAVAGGGRCEGQEFKALTY